MQIHQDQSGQFENGYQERTTRYGAQMITDQMPDGRAHRIRIGIFTSTIEKIMDHYLLLVTHFFKQTKVTKVLAYLPKVPTSNCTRQHHDLTTYDKFRRPYQSDDVHPPHVLYPSRVDVFHERER